MPEFLVFLLHAPLGAMGGVAVGERRAGFDRPAKSAVLGLVGAALGLDRTDEPAHLALTSGYSLCLGEIAPGRLTTDYHTAQVPPRRGKRFFATRKAEVSTEDLGTILSFREYRAEPAWLVMLRARGGVRWRLSELALALARPEFVLFFGRKSCPLALPVDARVIDADEVPAAVSRYIDGRTLEQARLLHELGLDGRPTLLAADLDFGLDAATATRIERRRDHLASRRRWQFDTRAELVLFLGEPP
jgi:CRISPR system Cascade subunit CasD